ncbi:protein CASPARIAN STRIP INTEGRITY FACTOR 2-like isoform X1 [Cannabis sativa]|uniref:protein CASPARIAN STRIP INTEGRITY FACTOR 2-like isoform X1 n=1 Tax=Cannabis sativa TaxID=3483 RepID=UPI0029C9D8AF|nr:protein CASPARIAN STRIP INTEGRITY FACTOR 2-like isoform X1 [Cannabis sativa]
MSLIMIVMKNISLIFLLISGSLISTSLAGRQLMNSGDQFSKVVMIREAEEDDDEMLMMKKIRLVHERVLRSNTRDYGRYDPAPALVKPPFKLIPN